MLTDDLIQAVASRSEEVGVGVKDGTVGRKGDDRLRPADRFDLRLIILPRQTIGGIAPFHDGPQTLPARAHNGLRDQVELDPTDLDRGLKQPAHLRDHLLLMIWILMKNVDVAANKTGNLKGRQIALDGLFRLRQEPRQRFIDIDDVAVIIGHHDASRQIVQNGQQARRLQAFGVEAKHETSPFN